MCTLRCYTLYVDFNFTGEFLESLSEKYYLVFIFTRKKVASLPFARTHVILDASADYWSIEWREFEQKGLGTG